MPQSVLTEVDLPLPPPELRLMRDSDERFLAVAGQLATLLYRLGLRNGSRLLDVGCSCGRLPIGLLTDTRFAGTYLGFDVMRNQVMWARKALTPLAPNLTFKHVDVRNDRYNPKGAVRPETLRFPADDADFDVACLFSIFTHFYGADIALYLRELRRVIKPGGIVVATWFLYDDANLERAQTTSAYPMTYRHDDVTIYHDPDDPLRAIAFEEGYVRRLVREAGLEIVDVEHGTWVGGPGPEFQDVVVLRRPDAAPVERVRLTAERGYRRARRALGRLRRRVRAEVSRRRAAAPVR